MLAVPENKFVVSIPDYPKVNPSLSKNPQETEVTENSIQSDSADESGKTAKPVVSSVKQIISKGTENTVPALPTLPPTEDGNQFDGWVNKTTGETVKKGDKLTGNIEIKPIWKDCGESMHINTDKDHCCDKCGCILIFARKKKGK